MNGPVTLVWPRGIPRVGQQASIARVFTRDDIDLFDSISRDVHPFHHDDAIASNSPLEGICLQSGVSTAIFNRLLTEELPGPWSFFLEIQWKYLAPVRPGQEVLGTLEVLEVREDKPIARLRSRIFVSGDTLALDGTILTYTHHAPPGWIPGTKPPTGESQDGRDW